MIRGIVQSCIEGVVKRFTATGRSGESFTSREYMQHYGFSSRPLAGAEAVLIQDGNHIIMIASEDRRYRIGVEAGEVCLYTDEGDQIRFKRDKEIYIKSGNKLTAEIENEVNVTTKSATVNASESLKLMSPAIILQCDSLSIVSYDGSGSAGAALRGDFGLNGSLTATGNIAAAGTIIDESGNTNHHSH